MGGRLILGAQFLGRLAFLRMAGLVRLACSNEAFEEYKRSTLERLEAERRKLAEEERAFADFLRELRRARDREEFDHFMQSRRQQGNGSTGT